MELKKQFRFNLSWSLQTILVLGLLLFSVLIVLQQANPALSVLGRDAGAFAYMGERVLRGDAPYLSAWDSKPPGTFLVDAAGIWLGRGTRWGIWLLEFVSLSAASIFGFLAIRKQFGVGAALIASMIWLYGLNGILVGGNLTEEYSLFFGFLSVLLFSFSLGKESTLWADIGIGLCAGSSFLFRPNNMGVQVSLALTIAILLMLEKRYLDLFKRLAAIGLSALLPLGLMSVYLLSKGALQAFWDASIVYNFSYAGGHRFNPFSAFASGLSQIGFPAGVALFGLFIAGNEAGTQVRDRARIHPILLWITLDGMIEIVLSGLSGQNYEHYFINWLPFIAFASALLTSRALPQFVEWVQKRALLFLLIFATVFGLYFRDVPVEFWRSIQPLLQRSGPVQHVDLVAEYANVNTSPDQTVLVWGGQAGINFLAQRDSPTPYLFYPLYVPSKMTDRMSEDFYRRLAAHPPELILDGSTYNVGQLIPLSTASPLTWLSDYGNYNTPYLLETLKFVRENYALVDNVNGVDIYRLKR